MRLAPTAPTLNPIVRYTRWLHTQWPAGGVERLPDVEPDGSTNVPGLYVVGDLAGIPLLKMSADSGARVMQAIARDANFQHRLGKDGKDPHVLDIAIVGGGVAGFSAALEAKKLGLSFAIYEASAPFATIVNFPKAKRIYTYPTQMTPAGQLRFHEKSNIKEGLLDDLREQTLAQGVRPTIAEVDHVRRSGALLELVIPGGVNVKAHRVIVAIGRSGNFRRLDAPGEDLPKVYNRLHDPNDYAGMDVLVVGGGDSALETAIAITRAGGRVTLSYRGSELARPKPDNIDALYELAGEHVYGEEPGSLARVQRAQGAAPLVLALDTTVERISEAEVTLRLADGQTASLRNDVVFSMIGREAPLAFFRKSGVRIRGEWHIGKWLGLIAMMLLVVWLYHWKKPGVFIGGIPALEWLAGIGDRWKDAGWFPYNVPHWWASLGSAFDNPANLLGTMKISLGSPGFYYSFLYCAIVVAFGITRIRRRKTPYVTWQTITLALIQVIPLFLLPYVLLPWAGSNGWFDSGMSKSVADSLFPLTDWGHGREYWRAFGLILAWPLFIFNVFTAQPLWGWLIISVVQTFVLIPAMIYFWGKGAYCGWICSCGALAETLGDRQRHKMPHGPLWNRMNMIGQVFLLFALVLLIFRAAGWVMGDESWPARSFQYLSGIGASDSDILPLLNYVWFVDLFWAGILGIGLYFHFSGRVWCRFACPLAALMHIYTRFSRFRILAEKKKCISCNVCTTVCHQGIDVMSFANKGEPMEDPQCVRCSACVQSCPTGVLSFGQVDRQGNVISEDPAWLRASPVRTVEITVSAREGRTKVEA